MSATLIKRRDKIGKAYFAKVLPFDRFRLDANGALAWDDLSNSVKDTRIAWFAFDNATGVRTPAAGPSPWAVAEITAASRPKQSVHVYVRSGTIVGLDRTW